MNVRIEYFTFENCEVTAAEYIKQLKEYRKQVRKIIKAKKKLHKLSNKLLELGDEFKIEYLERDPKVIKDLKTRHME